MFRRPVPILTNRAAGALAIACLALAVALAAGCSRQETPPGEGPLQLTDPRVRALIPGQDKTVGYFTARNAGAADWVLTAARSDAARAIEIHTTLRDGDMVRMRRLNEVVIAAGETVRFEPGGKHLMLFGVAELGDSLDVVLVARDGGEVQVRFRVTATGEM